MKKTNTHTLTELSNERRVLKCDQYILRRDETAICDDVVEAKLRSPEFPNRIFVLARHHTHTL